MWPEKVQRQFDIARATGNASDILDNVLHAPYNKLLNTLFPVDTDFTVIPNFQEINSTNGVDYLVTFEIFWENRPVFVLGLKREKDFSVRSKRTAADDQLRGRMGDLIGNTLLPLFQYLQFIYCRCLSSTGLARCQCFRDQALLLLRYEGRIDLARIHSRLSAIRDRYRTGWPLEPRYPFGSRRG
jgi:hypothetical protein